MFFKKHKAAIVLALAVGLLGGGMELVMCPVSAKPPESETRFAGGSLTLEGHPYGAQSLSRRLPELQVAILRTRDPGRSHGKDSARRGM